MAAYSLTEKGKAEMSVSPALELLPADAEEVSRRTGWDISATRAHLAELARLGYVRIERQATPESDMRGTEADIASHMFPNIKQQRM